MKCSIVIRHDKVCRIDRFSSFTKKLPFGEKTLVQNSP